MTADALFVAHNARFDYGFLKHAFARQQRAFSARVLCTVRLSRRLYPDEPRHNLDSVIARHGLADRRAAPGARRRARAVDLRPGALPRPRSGSDRSRGEARPENAEPAAAASARRARRAARGAGRLSLLRPQRAAALHRQEHQSARARRRAFFVRLSLRDRPAPVDRDPADRVRGNRGRDRRAAARSRARQVDAARAQPRAAPQGRVGRARVAGDARAAGVHSGRRRGAGGARGHVRAVHVEAPCARDAALARVRARAVLESAGAREAAGALLRAAGQALRRRVRRRRIRRSASRAPRARRSRRTPFRAGRSPGSPPFASARCSAIAPTCT